MASLDSSLDSWFVESLELSSASSSLFVLLGVDDGERVEEVLGLDVGGAHVVRTPGERLDGAAIEAVAFSARAYGVKRVVLPAGTKREEALRLLRHGRLPAGVGVFVDGVGEVIEETVGYVGGGGSRPWPFGRVGSIGRVAAGHPVVG